MIRCVMGDDRTLFRDILQKALEGTQTLRIVEGYPDARQAAERAIATQADILILGIKMPGSSPFNAARWAKEQNPRLRVTFLTSSTLPQHIQSAKRAGANGYLMVTASIDELIDALLIIARGGTCFNTPCCEGISTHPEQLSPRQVEVLKLLAEGNTVKETAVLLDLSAKTIEVHKSHIMTRLGLHTNVELTRYAIKNQVVSLD